jgi:hypothetical protein
MYKQPAILPGAEMLVKKPTVNPESQTKVELHKLKNRDLKDVDSNIGLSDPWGLPVRGNNKPSLLRSPKFASPLVARPPAVVAAVNVVRRPLSRNLQ